MLHNNTSNKNKQRILFFGDSLTAGYGLAEDLSFPALIQQKINEFQLPYQVINAGLSGETSAGGKNRILNCLDKQIDVFVLELGINDILRGITVAETITNLQFIIDAVKAKNPNVKLLLLGMELPAFLTGHILMEFKNIFRNLAVKNNMALLPFILNGVAGNRLLNLTDGVHPNAKGYEIIAANVWHQLKPML